MPVTGAVIEAECEPGQSHKAAAALAELPPVFSVHMISGASQFYALVTSVEGLTLSRLLVDQMPALPGLRRVRSSLMSTWFTRTDWRLGGISSTKEGELRPEEPEAPAAFRPFDDFDMELFLALQDDGRYGYRELAARLGRSEQAVKRRLTALIRQGQISFRTDFVRVKAGWPIHVALWMRVPDENVAEVGSQLRNWPETRVCTSLVSDKNLFATMQVHGLPELERTLARVRRTWNDVEIADRQVILRSVKSWGRLLDEDGYAIGVVPVNPWYTAQEGMPPNG